MTDTPQSNELSRLQKAAYALKEMRARLDDAEGAQREPIAIVGMSGRFPGAASCEALWQLLVDGVDAVGEIPAERWSLAQYYDANANAPGKMNARCGGFLEGVDQFDPAFFGIPAREAVKVDPQQRLLLEVAWEALENAGQAPDRLQGTETGTYLGINQMDYGLAQFDAPGDMDIYTTTGNGFCFAAGRISYALGLQGPNMAVDTACSSSLVAVHLACQALRNRECDLALAGGVQLNLVPTFHLLLAKTQSLAASGRCNTFSANADGLIMGEGCGLVVLKRLSDAVADKNRILALIRGSGVNHGGAASGITVPNELAQEKLVRQVLDRANVDPAEVGYVETHGTGTQLGDPIEVGALSSVFRERPQDDPLVLGSLKTNIGHLDAAAGIAGLIKAVLSLEREKIPPNLHFDEPNPRIDWLACPLKVPVEPHAWPRGEKVRHAGVSSFGFSGTNSHVVLAEAPLAKERADAVERPLHVFALSAKTDTALGELVAAYCNYLDAEDLPPLADICFTATAGRSHFDHRLAVVADSTLKLRADLQSWKKRGETAVYCVDTSGSATAKVAFVFGDDSDVPGVRELYATHPSYRASVDRCAGLLGDIVDGDLSPLFAGERTASTTVQRHVVHFVAQYALAELWRAWNITPAAVAGCGVGEYVAACIAGVLSLEDGLQLVAARSILLEEIENSPAADMGNDLEEFAQRAAALANAPRLSFLSGSLGQFLVANSAPAAGYWRQLVRVSADRDQWLEALETKDCRHLLFMAGTTGSGGAPVLLNVDESAGGTWRAVASVLAQLYCEGISIDWQAFAAPYSYRHCLLPTYPFQRQRYWFTASAERNSAPQLSEAEAPPLQQARDEVATEVEIDRAAILPCPTSTAVDSTLNRIMAQQLQTASTAISQVVAQQLEYLRNSGAVSSSVQNGASTEADTEVLSAPASLGAPSGKRADVPVTKLGEEQIDTPALASAVTGADFGKIAEPGAPDTSTKSAEKFVAQNNASGNDSHQLLLLSADAVADLDAQTQKVVRDLQRDPAGLASTVGALRADPARAQRRMLVCKDAADAIGALDGIDPKRVTTHAPSVSAVRSVVFMFPGVGDHYMGMGRELYESEAVFRHWVDICCALVAPALGEDLLGTIYPPVKEEKDAGANGGGLDLRRMLKRGPAEPSNEPLAQTRLNQPAVFIVEYALAQLWMSWGLTPQAMIGYSVGEYVAACLSDVMSLEDALVLLVCRAQLIDKSPAGAMLAVPLPEEQIRALLTEHPQLSISIISTPAQCVIGGPPEAIAALEESLKGRKTLCRRLPTTHAFHSQMLDGLHEPIVAAAQAIRLGEPQIPFLSNLTGTWITASEARAPRYWAEHTYKTVRFAEAVGEVLKAPNRLLLEVGPGQNLSSFVFQHPAYKEAEGLVVLPSLRNAYDRQSDRAFVLNTLGKLWLSGMDLDWGKIFKTP